jgi:para-aminobenzoate synthetase component 1
VVVELHGPGFGGVTLTGLCDLSHDLADLDRPGIYLLIMAYSGKPVVAHFRSTRPIDPVTPAGPTFADPSPDPGWVSSLTEAEHRELVGRIVSEIALGNYYQVNLCRILSRPGVGAGRLVALGHRLRSHQPAPFGATILLEEAGIQLISCSPELFLARDGQRVTTSPMKGTASGPEAFLAKDRAENLMIVDLMRNDLSRVCETGSVRVPDLFAISEHPGLWQMTSTITGTLKAGVSWPELLAATFPPGSVTGAPKMAAVQEIARVEPTGRGLYCGIFGWVKTGWRGGSRARLAVTIRSFSQRADRLELGVGGAITCYSNAAGEWAETELKASRLIGHASPALVP